MEISDKVYQDVPSYRLVKLKKLEYAHILEQEQPQKRNYTGILIGIIILLIFISTGSAGIIIYLVSQGRTFNTMAMNPSSGTFYTPGGNSIVRSQQAAVTETGVEQVPLETTPIFSNPIMAGLVNEQAKQAMANPAYSNMYSQAMGQATDVKRKADLNALATTMNIYLMEYDGQLPDNFPDDPRCIGTDPACYDLYKILVPDYLDKPYMDAVGGTIANTGYKIGRSHDGFTAFISQATGTNNEIIEVKK